MHRKVLVEFNATWQGNGTVQDLLIMLDKLAALVSEFYTEAEIVSLVLVLIQD